MSSKQTQGSMVLVGALSGTVGVVAFLMLMVMGGWTFSPAFFVAILIAILVALFLLVAFHKKTEVASGGAAAADGTDTVAAPAAAPAAAKAAPAASTAPAPAPEPKPAPAPAAAPASSDSGGGAAVSDADKPALLSAPRDGGPDNLKEIKGIGPKLENTLHGMGIYHFDQMAKWTERELGWVDENLEGFKGRASRDNWIEQAKILAAGGETEFSKRVDKGGVY